MRNSNACESVVVKRVGAGDSYGNRSTSDDPETGWYVEPSNKRIATSTGEEVLASLFAVAPAGSVAKTNDRVSWGGRLYRVVQVDALRRRGRVHHLELYLSSVAQ